ncbi:MAG: hypothetical protein ACT4R6_06065 [Gemmatimonadaceae bacterium]
MRKLTMLAAAVALVALGASTGAAQDTTRKESKGEVAKPATFATLVVAVDSAAPTAVKLGTVTPETVLKIEVVDVKTLVTTPADEAALKASVEKSKDAIKALQEELKKRPAVVQAIDSHAMEPEPGDVVAAELQEGDRLVVYFWKR